MVFATIAASSAHFCWGPREKRRTLYQEAHFDMANLDEIAKQIQRISQIKWEKLVDVQILKDNIVTIELSGDNHREVNVAYYVAVIQSLVNVKWEKFNSKMPSEKESQLKEIATLLYRFSEKVFELFGKYMGNFIRN